MSYSLLNTLLVGIGGFLGAIARYQFGGWVMHHTMQARFPWSTFAVNVAGCFVIGALSAMAEKFGMIGPSARLFLFTGILGGFTTFSAFGLETAYLLRRGETAVAAAYVGGSVLVGLAALWIAFRLVCLLQR